MIRKVHELKRLILQVDQNDRMDEIIEIVEGQKKCRVQMIHEIGRGEATMISQGRVLFHSGVGPLGSSVSSNDLRTVMVTYIKNDTKSFSKVIKAAEKEAERLANERLEEIERVKEQEKKARIADLKRQLAEEEGVEEAVEISDEVLSHFPDEE